MIADARARFNASTGDIVALDRMVPQAGDLMWGQDTSDAHGFAVYADLHYVVRFYMVEDDGSHTDYEEMGEVFHFLGTGEHGLGIGTHVGRATGADGGHVGDYIVTYEIRRALLPDLRPSQITVHDLPGSTKKRVCTGVQNIDLADAGPFELAIRVDGSAPEGGRTAAGRS